MYRNVSTTLLFTRVYAGGLYLVSYKPYGSKRRIKSFMGVCTVAKKNRLESRIVLRNLIGLFCIEFSFFTYSPLVVDLIRYRDAYFRPGRANLKLLRGKPLKLSSFKL
jgi:ribosomal protein L19